MAQRIACVFYPEEMMALKNRPTKAGVGDGGLSAKLSAMESSGSAPGPGGRLAPKPRQNSGFEQRGLIRKRRHFKPGCQQNSLAPFEGVVHTCISCTFVD
jgi:hypothetical protein